jgi:hypothetical protein
VRPSSQEITRAGKEKANLTLKLKMIGTNMKLRELIDPIDRENGERKKRQSIIIYLHHVPARSYPSERHHLGATHGLDIRQDVRHWPIDAISDFTSRNGWASESEKRVLNNHDHPDGFPG